MRRLPVPFSPVRNRRGFTLLELLLVVTILSAVAWVSLSSVSTTMDQVRFDDTRNRLQAIRRAIIGDISRTVNGGPELRGYVADMGKLPEDLNALMAREYCRTDPKKTTAADCGAGWVSQPIFRNYSSTGLWAGWNGPYLPPAEFSRYPRFQDGWGKDDGTVNFGWNYSYQPGDPATEWNAGYLLVQSYGRDGAPGPLDDNSFDADYPSTSQPLVRNSEWRFLVTDSGSGGLKVDFGSPASGTHYLCMAVAYRFWNGTAMDIKEIKSDGTEVTLTGNGTQKILTFIMKDDTEPDTWLPLGQAAYGIFEHPDGDGGDCKDITTATATVFPATSARWTVFSVVPGMTLQPFKRNVN